MSDEAENLPEIVNSSPKPRECYSIDEVQGLRLRQKRFLNAWVTCGNITSVCEATGVGRNSHYRWLGRDRAYKEAFEIAKKMFVDFAIGDIRSRAFIGEPVEITRRLPDGSIETKKYMKKSDVLAIFEAKALDEAHRENYQVVTAIGPVAVSTRIGNLEIAIGDVPKIEAPKGIK